MEGGDALLPFVSRFYGSPSTYLWKMTKEEHMRSCRAREANKVTLLCRLCWALEAIQARLRPSERLMAFLDDICCVSSPERTAAGFTAIQEELLTIGIRVHEDTVAEQI